MKIRTHFIVTILLILFPLTAFTEEVYFYHTDNFGTPMVMTDINGDVVWRSDELPFGEEYETIENPIKNNRRYLGKEMDEETGFIYMGSRYLNPKTGQFNRPDPVGLVDPATGKVNQEMLLNPQRLNRYAYGLNNPYRFVDADGRNAKDIESSILNPYEMTEGGGPGRGIGASPNGATFSFKGFLKSPSAKSTGKEIGILRSAAQGKGNFGLGSGTRAEANKLGKAWVGKGYNVASDGKTLVSKDGLRQYRPPSYKPRLNKSQANFEQRFSGQKSKKWQSNGHLDIKD